MKYLNKATLPVALGMVAAFSANGWAQSFDLKALIEGAKKEPQLTIFDSTGKIKTIAKNFAAKYGIDAVGTKVPVEVNIEMMDREARAKNVQSDVAIISDAAAVVGQLIPTGAVESWVPGDLESKIPKGKRDPLVVVSMVNAFAYNAELSDSCPIKNLWELTDAKWHRHVGMNDPLSKSVYIDAFNQMETHADAAVAEAYEAHYGKPLKTDLGSATKALVAGIAANGPLLASSDTATAETVGAPGQTEQFIGLMSTAKFRENKKSGYNLGLCTDIKPFIGITNVGVGVIATGSDNPYGARLFIHYVLTAEGIAPQAQDGKISSNSDVGLPDSEPSGIAAHLDKVLPYDMSTAASDWDNRQDWQDLWRIHYKR